MNPHAIEAGRGIEILCAVCRKPVDRLEKYRNEARMCDVYKVWCHGETDECEIEDINLVEAGEPQDFRRGEAFTNGRKRIEP